MRTANRKTSPLVNQSESALARRAAADWAGQTEAARGSIFNITNGDYFRWQHMWPKIARAFGMDVANPVPTPLATYMADKGPLWERMTEKYGLEYIPYDKLVSWPFGDFLFNSGFDNVSSTIEARRAGFHACIDTQDMFTAFFERLRTQRIIPEA